MNAPLAGCLLVASALGPGLPAQQWTFGQQLTGRSAVIAYDLGRARVMLFGGTSPIPSGSVLFNESWWFDGDDWHLVPAASRPTPRSSPAIAYDWVRDRTILFGGTQGGALFGDTWEYDGVHWTQISTVHAPSARATPVAFDLNHGCTVLFSGAGLADT
jgi:hypothetical protein